MSHNLRFKRSEDVAFRQVGDEWLLVPIRTQLNQDMAIFSLNPVGAFLWTALAVPMGKEELVERTRLEFDTEGKDVANDVSRFIDLLLARRLLVEVSE